MVSCHAVTFCWASSGHISRSMVAESVLKVPAARRSANSPRSTQMPATSSAACGLATAPIVWLQFSPIRWISSPGDVLIVSVAGVSAVPHG